MTAKIMSDQEDIVKDTDELVGDSLYTRNLVLSEMITGIIFYGVVCQIILIPVVFFWLDGGMIYYSGGLWIGIISAALLAVHMNNSISNALDYDEASAVKLVKKGAIIRYIILLIVFGIMMVTDILNPLTAFIGAMGLKIGAYIQPITHGVLRKAGPFGVRDFIKADDIRREKMLQEYYEEQKRLKEEKALKNSSESDVVQDN